MDRILYDSVEIEVTEENTVALSMSVWICQWLLLEFLETQELELPRVRRCK